MEILKKSRFYHNITNKQAPSENEESQNDPVLNDIPQRLTERFSNEPGKKVDKTFLSEQYILNQRIDLIHQIDTIQQDLESEFTTIAVKMLVQNLFIKKFRLDVGFRFHLLKEIETKPEIHRHFFRDCLRVFDSARERNGCVQSIRTEQKNERELEATSESGENENDNQEDLDDLQFYKANIKLDAMNQADYNELFKSAFITEDYKEHWFHSFWMYCMKYR